MKQSTEILRLRWWILASTLAASGCASNEEEPEYYEAVRRVFASNCFPCHGQKDDFQAGLDLRSVDTILEGGRSGPAVMPGDPGRSLLYEMVSTDRMPPDDEHLSKREIEIIACWITYWR